MKTLDAIKKLNGIKKEDGKLLLKEPIDLKELKGAKEKDLAEAFLTAIESIPEKDDSFIPEDLAVLYNELAATEEKAEPEKKAPEKAKGKKEDKKPAETKKPAEKKAEVKVEEKKAPEKKKQDKTETAKIAPKEKAPAKSNAVDGKKVRTGWKEGSKCDSIHQLINNAGAKGISLKDAAVEATKFNANEGYVKAVFAECVRNKLAKQDGDKFFSLKK